MHVMMPSSHVRLRGGLDATWTPNGEGPAPFSTKARQEMGMDPTAMAGGATTGAGGGLQMGSVMLLVMYLANNWNVALAVQAFIMKLLAPLINSISARQKANQLQAAAAAKKARLAARKARLKAAAAKDDAEEDGDD
jgi:hypothetical protein